MNGRASEISVKNPAESPFLNSLLGPRAPAEGGDLIAHCIPHSFIACHKRSAVVGLRIVIDRGGVAPSRFDSPAAISESG
jgi:hypothetical protein